MNVLGSITLSGLALGAAIELVLAVRGSGVFKLHTRDKVAGFSLFTGIVWVAAGGAWASTAQGMGGVPTSLLGSGSGLGNPGQGGIALALTLLMIGPSWKKKWVVALLGICAAVAYGTAGGVWGVPVNIVRMGVGRLTGAA